MKGFFLGVAIVIVGASWFENQKLNRAHDLQIFCMSQGLNADCTPEAKQ